MNRKNNKFVSGLTLATLMVLLLTATFVTVSQGGQSSSSGPQEIAADVSCGKCGMFPAKYPVWQTQIVFTDGKMVPFDGSKCMFGFLMNMGEYDKAHTSADVAAIWAKEFNSGKWIDAKGAHYVIGSDEMGPMGKELIPFADAASAEAFQKEHRGHIATFDAIDMATLKPLMGKMHMKGHNKMNGEMGSGSHMEKQGHQAM